MLKKISPFMIMCIILLISCSSAQTQRSYKDMLLEDDYAIDRKSTKFIMEAQKECPNITKGIKDLEAKLSRSEASDSDHAKRELQWLQNWSRKLGCEGNRTDLEAMPSLETLTIDKCFSKCKELTSRTDEACFDACICR